MAKLWDDVRKSLKDFGSAAMEKAEEFGKVASDKAEELTKVGKINWEIKQLKRDREKQYLELGQLTFNAAKKNEVAALAKNDAITQLVNEIKSLNAEINLKQARIDAIHAEFGMPAEEVGDDVEVDITPTAENEKTPTPDADVDPDGK